MGKRTMKTVLGGGGYYIALLLCVAAIGVGGYYALFHTPAETTGDTTNQQEPAASAQPAASYDPSKWQPPFSSGGWRR